MGAGLGVVPHAGPDWVWVPERRAVRPKDQGGNNRRVKFLLCKEVLGKRCPALGTGRWESTGNAEAALVTGRRGLAAECCGEYIFLLWLFFLSHPGRSVWMPVFMCGCVRRERVSGWRGHRG